MGTKRKLTPQIKKLVETCQPGPLLDAFAGMCSVGTEVGSARPVWANDLQFFSNLMAGALFCSEKWPPLLEATRAAILEPYQANFRSLAGLHGTRLEREERALAALDHSELRLLFEETLGSADYETTGGERPYNLFAERYGATYFSVAQAMEIDSLRYAADSALAAGAIDADAHRWLLIAIATAMNRCTTSTGHFAQPLSPKAANVTRIATQRRRSILTTTLQALDSLRPIGSARWRRQNKVFNGDATDLLDLLMGAAEKPAVVYADPPYTDDQYSRFYHLYETMVLYDYPACSGRGQYRTGRATSKFCLPTKVSAAVDRLIEGVSALGADMILSYPPNGVLKDSRNSLVSMFERHFGRTPEVIEITHTHSTMGASKGAAAAEDVIEHIYRVES